MEVVGEMPNRTKVKRRKACDPWVSQPPVAKPDIRMAGRAYWRRVGRKFRVLTRGELSVSAAAARAVVT